MSNPAEIERALKMINDAAQAGGDFAMEQLPLVAKEVIYWSIASSSGWVVFVSVLLAFAVFLLKKANDWRKEETDRWKHGDTLFAVGATGFASIFLFFTLMVSLSCTIKGIVAPRLVLIDYVKEFVK